MHFNHPEWNTKEAMEKIVPKLKKLGYSFAKLENYELTSLVKKAKDDNQKLYNIKKP